MYLDQACKSPHFQNGTHMFTFLAILLAVFATFGTAFRRIETEPKDSSSFIAASPNSGASRGTVFKTIEHYGTAVPTFLAKSPTYGRA